MANMRDDIVELVALLTEWVDAEAERDTDTRSLARRSKRAVKRMRDELEIGDAEMKRGL